MLRRPICLPVRLLDQITETPGGCWEYVASPRNKWGYRGIRWHGRTVYIHRLVWFLVRRYAPKGGCVLHTCDNPPCCNPEHLVQGSHSQNLKHQYRRNRRRPQEIYP